MPAPRARASAYVRASTSSHTASVPCETWMSENTTHLDGVLFGSAHGNVLLCTKLLAGAPTREATREALETLAPSPFMRTYVQCE